MLCVAGRLVYSWKSVTFIWFDLQRKAFEEDRATWLKHQFLNLSPFAESKKPQMSKSKSAFLICKCVLFYIVLSQFTIVLIMLSSKVDCWMLIVINKLNDKNTYRLSKYWLICWSHSFILQLWCSYSISVYWNSFSLLVVFILFITKNKSVSSYLCSWNKGKCSFGSRKAHQMHIWHNVPHTQMCSSHITTNSRPVSHTLPYPRNQVQCLFLHSDLWIN